VEAFQVDPRRFWVAALQQQIDIIDQTVLNELCGVCCLELLQDVAKLGVIHVAARVCPVVKVERQTPE
jgi:uncharacterized cysteine cluster protein YcgN (CxxCxxCC family)